MEEFEKVMGAFRNLFQNLLDAATQSKAEVEKAEDDAEGIRAMSMGLRNRIEELEKMLAEAESGAPVAKVDLGPVMVKLDAILKTEGTAVNLEPVLNQLAVLVKRSADAVTADLNPVLSELANIKAVLTSGGGGGDADNWNKLWANLATIRSDVSFFKDWIKKLPF